MAGRQQLHLPQLRMSLSTVYAWSRILAAYARRHPRHQVRIFYHERAVQDLRLLVRQSPQLDPSGFEMRVETADGDSREVVALLRLMERAGGPDAPLFLTGDDPDGWFTEPPAIAEPGSRPAATGLSVSGLTRAR